MISESEFDTKKFKKVSTKNELQQQVVIHNIKQFFLKNLQICRICLETEDDSKGSAQLVPITSAIWSFLELQDRTLPNTICTKCQIKVLNFMILMENCAESNEILSKVRDEIGFSTETKGEEEEILFSEGESMEVDPKNEVFEQNSVSEIVSMDSKDDEMLRKNSFTIVDNKFVCNLCEKLSDSKQSHVTHMKTSHTRPEKCPVEGCSKAFGIPSMVRRHLQQVHTEQDLSMFDEEQEMTFKIGPSGKYECFYCKEEYTKRYNLEKHIEKMHQKPDEACEICGKVFNEVRMRIHMKIHQKLFECHDCGRRFVDKFLLKKHLIALHLREKTYLCSKCGDSFTSAQNLRRHVYKVHEKLIPRYNSSLPEEKKGICKYCGLKFSDKYELGQHVKTHTLIYKCKICAKKFASEITLTNHEKSHTENEEFQFKCTTCDKRYQTKAHLKAHFDRFHVIREQWLCTYCQKRLPGRRALDAHEKSHEGVKEFGCFLCEKAFTTTQRLKMHLITNHTKSKYRCGVCKNTQWQSQRGFEGHMKREHPDLFTSQPDMSQYFERDEPTYSKLMETYREYLKELSIKRRMENSGRPEIEVEVLEVKND
ncbi:zinc finger protein ZFP2-like [Culicoides brevitarsis]|uniref:zinc finger protein ZFP2-like n=1 Tax=Culicoides brevitarsis TaxID=469753 RepID=UPI00307C2798